MIRMNKVSLRGASAQEITRDALLQKATLERSIRKEARRSATAAQFIQRVWRGYHVVCKAEDTVRSEWDDYIAEKWPAYQSSASVQILVDCILRPFLFFTRRSLQKGSLRGDVDRFVLCFKILLQSISSPDPSRNYCSLSVGTVEEQNTWRHQVHFLLRLSCIGLVEGAVGHHSEMTTVACLAARMLVTLTDCSMWLSFSDEDSRARAKLATQKILEWVGEGNIPLYPALGICIDYVCPSKFEDGERPAQLQREKLLIVASSLTIALRPLQHFHNQEDIGVDQKQSLAKPNAAFDFCSCVLTVPSIVQRLPAAILPALQHPSVLNQCLQAFEALAFQTTTLDIYSSFNDMAKKGILESNHGTISPSLAALNNILALSKRPTVDGTTKFVDTLDLNAYLKAVCSLLDQLLPWLKSLQTDHKGDEHNNLSGFLFHGGGLCKDISSGFSLMNIKLQVMSYLEPYCQYWHLKELLSSVCQNRSSDPGRMESGLKIVYANLKLPDIAMLYLKLLAVFKSLHEERIPCPVLNLLAFAPGFLHQLWAWLDDALGLTQDFIEKCSIDMAEVAETSKRLHKGASRKDERLGGSLSSRWAFAVSKIKGKGSNSDGVELDSRVNEELRSFNVWEAEKLKNGGDSSIWEIKKMKSDLLCIPEEVMHVLTLFCASYCHLLMILDDDEFYEKQVPFTLKQQRIIAASLNTLVYNGLLSTSKHKFLSLLEMAIKCLNSLYGRDCRRSFCSVNLWLAPAIASRHPIPAAARAHELAMSSLKLRDYSQASAIGYVLALIPHVIPFEERVQIFREFVKADKASRKMAGEFMGPGPGSIEVVIRRDHLVEDAFAQLNPLGSRFKSAINVSFVNEHGLSEAGLDYGGLFKEFLTDLAKAAFDPGYGLFIQKETDEGLLFPHPAAGNLPHGLQMLEFLGRVVGKAIYEGILIDYSFSHVFIWKLLGHYVFFDELSTLDPELHHSLMYLKHYEGDVADLALDFTITEELFGKRKVVELKIHGAQIQVTNENKLQYVYAMADYKLNKQMQPLINAFSRGLSDIISPSWLSLFNARELNQLISGGDHDFDVDDLRENTKYTGGYTANSRTVKQFWEVLREFGSHERCALLKFVTSCSRAPLLGFKHLQPAFTIHKVTCDTTVWAMLGGQDVDRLPSASTCYNTLKLPTYKRMSTLKTKLRYAIQSNAGFELS